MKTEKKSLIRKKQKNDFAHAAHFFFVHFFAIVLDDDNVKLPGTS